MLTQEAERIIRAFRQLGEGNCVSIAIIKAGIDAFGVGRVFDRVEREGGYYVVLRDGFDLSLTPEEVATAGSRNGFRQLRDDDASSEIFRYAQLAFAVMAKRAQLDGNDNHPPGSMTYEQAIDALNDGEHYSEGPRWIGLQHYVRPIGARFRFRYNACVAASPKHCFYISHGYEDQYGTPDLVGWLERWKVRHLYRLADEAVY